MAAGGHARPPAPCIGAPGPPWLFGGTVEENSMDARDVCIWMPELWGTGRVLRHEAALPAVRRLWPGLPGRLARPCPAPSWTPPDLPAAPAAMGAFMADLEAFAAEAARGGPAARQMLAARLARESAARLDGEMNDVAALGGRPSAAAAADGEDLRAQRLLAWFWFQQKNLADIAELTARVNAGVRGLGEGLARDTGLEPEVEAGVIPLVEDLRLDAEGMAGDWRVWLEAALRLTPKETVFVLERLPAGLEDKSFAPAGWTGRLEAPGVRARGLETPAAALLPGRSCPGGRTVRLALAEYS